MSWEPPSNNFVAELYAKMTDSARPSPRPPGLVRLLVAALALALFAVAALVLRQSFFEVERLYTDGGIEGPFRPLVKPDGTVEAGPAVSRVRAGEPFAIVSTLCLEAGVAELYTREIVRRSDGVVINVFQRFYPAGARGCGPIVGTFAIPADAQPGSYEMRRRIELTPRRGPTLSVGLASLYVEVTP